MTLTPDAYDVHNVKTLENPQLHDSLGALVKFFHVGASNGDQVVVAKRQTAQLEEAKPQRMTGG